MTLFFPGNPGTGTCEEIGICEQKHDSLNRLASAQTAATNQPMWPGDTGGLANCWSEEDSYDAWGNLWSIAPSSSSLYTGCSQESSLNMLPTANNQLQDTNNDYLYDAAGNLLYDGTHQYFYDAENRLAQVDGTLGYCSTKTGTAATACYYYDAEGHRMHRTGIADAPCDHTATSDFVYDLDGHWTTQYNGTAGACRSEIYIGSRHLAAVAGDIDFVHADWLGTERMRFSYDLYNGGHLALPCTSLPFGDALNCPSGDSSTAHFTGKEHDYESGLDYFGARYDSSSMGRFMTADSGVDQHPEAPQSWNL